MFADLALARRIEGAEVSLSSDIAAAVLRRRSVAGAFARPFAGGIAVFTGPESPMTKVIGAGLDGPADDAEIAALEAAYFALGAGVRAEVATLADPAFGQQLTGRGYILKGFENVLGRPLQVEPSPASSSAIVIREASDQEAWKNAIIDGFESPDTGVISAPGEAVPRDVVGALFADMATARGYTRYVALFDGKLAGAGSMRLVDNVAQMCGASTLPRYRRRGIQSAMLQRRLQEAAAAGADVAILNTEPGSKSQQNGQRAGFALLYTRAVLIKQPPAGPA